MEVATVKWAKPRARSNLKLPEKTIPTNHGQFGPILITVVSLNVALCLDILIHRV